MRARSLGSALAAAAFAAALAGCTSGNSAIEPPFQSVDVSKIGKLQFAVGTADIGLPSSGGGFAVGLNTVVTFRKADGTSAFAVNTPVITGPPGFVVPNSGQAGTDAGTSHISGTPQQSSSTTTFGTSGQATLYGFGPNNYGPSGSFPPGDYALPFYADLLPGSTSGGYPTTTFYGVPPAFPASSIITGYNLGFVDFAAKPVSRQYQLAVTVPTAPGSSQKSYTYHASASMNAATVLPPFTGVVFTPTAAGGGTVAVTLPTGASEAYVQLNDTSSGALFGFAFHASSSQTLPDGSMSPGDGFSTVGVAFDYPALEAAAPNNTAQAPTILGGRGQDDISVSYPQTGSVPSSSRTRSAVTMKPRRR